MAKFHARTLLTTDLATAYTAMVDQALTIRKYTSLGNTDVQVDITEQDPGCRIHARRRVSVDLPGFMTKLMSPTNMYDQVDTWNPGSGGHTDRFEITVEGAPIHVSGTMSLREVDRRRRLCRRRRGQGVDPVRRRHGQRLCRRTGRQSGRAGGSVPQGPARLTFRGASGWCLCRNRRVTSVCIACVSCATRSTRTSGSGISPASVANPMVTVLL